MNKYGNHKITFCGYTFDSKAEMHRYAQLMVLQEAGQISDLTMQPEYELQEPFKDRFGHTHRAIKYRGDFAYTEQGVPVCEDVKGVRTEVFKLKYKLFLHTFPHIDFRIVE